MTGLFSKVITMDLSIKEMTLNDWPVGIEEDLAQPNNHIFLCILVIEHSPYFAILAIGDIVGFLLRTVSYKQ